MLTAAQHREHIGPAAIMATDGMASLSFPALCHIIEAHIEARPDIQPNQLMTLGNKLCGLADRVERENRK